MVACNVGFGPDGRTALADDGKGGARVWSFLHGPPATWSSSGGWNGPGPGFGRTRATARHWAPWEWWAFRGRSEWAVELLERARAGGGEVSPLTLGRCYWELSDEPSPSGTLTQAGCRGGPSGVRQGRCGSRRTGRSGHT